VLLPDNPATLAAAGHFADVPMLVGQNADEGSAMTPGYGAGAVADYHALLTRSFGTSADRIAALYPGGSDAERSASSKAILRDRGLGSLAKWYEARAAYGRAPVFGYVFSHVEPGPEAARYGAFHSSEIPYVLGTLDAAPERPYTALDRSIMQTLSSYWSNFIRNGNPNGAALPLWPALSPERPLLLELGADNAPQPILRPDVAKAMDDYVAQGGRLSLF
jgi:para-nitrobenzyl esterase